jgi:phenylalanyl-tRNA synthetase alpha chain
MSASDVLSAKVKQSLQDLGIGDEAGVASAVGELRTALDADLASAADSETLRIHWLGRKQGLIGAAADNWLKTAPGPLKRTVGKLINELRAHAESSVEAKQDAAAQELAGERVDVTLPGIRREIGSRHPVQVVMQEIEEIFRSMGYSVETGPEIETDYYNFEALNFPPDHPARDTQDTLFLAGDGTHLLRTHTSPVQIRTMEKQKPPVRAVVLGKVYRRDNPDASHSFMFHQMECFAVDTNISLCDLKGTLNEFTRRFFGPNIKTRFRPSFFPFTEPSAELDISCLLCGGSGCPVCKRTGWVELLGSGMIDPALYGFVGYDPEKVSGFAFGCGADRLALMKYGINDIQLLWQGDKRFLHQFR